MSVPSKKPGLSFSSTADGLQVVLRADQIRHDTITGLVAEWHEEGGRDDVEGALADLAEVCHPGRDPRPAEVDAALEAVEDAACLGWARMTISFDDAVQLRAELDALIRRRASRFARPGGSVPRQREGGEAA
ncbi:hypothetical protein [Streptomyces sp. URMC 124]|uniref:hypothetical protein n=1 Tax=Streptomyces sp. URMC 124 TaxID=3423405 RepID=UPI003F19D070